MSARREARSTRPSREVQIDLAEAVWQYRSNETQLRRLKASAAAQSTSRNHGANEVAHVRRIHAREAVQLSLVLAGHTELAGELIEEAGLLQRLSWARELGQERPELRARLTAVRRTIKALASL